MNTQHLNPNLIANIDLFAFIHELTGQDVDLGLTEHLKAIQKATGWDWFDRLDPIDVEVGGRAWALISAAFLAGYMTGRNPDLLILGDGGSFKPAAMNADAWVVAEGND